MKQAVIFLAVIVALLISSCRKQSPASIASGSVIVINEGNFQHGNADLSLYDPVKKTVSNNVFFATNNFAMGDVAQSLCLIHDTAYIVMNNSQRVVVADVGHNFKYLYSINIANSSPRFFLPVSNRKAYVTELYANKIWVVDYRAGTVLKTITVNGWTEQMVAWGNHIYVSQQANPTGPVSPSSYSILMIDTATDQISSSLSLNSNPGSMVLTAQNKLFVLAQKQTTPAQNGSLYEIDIASFSLQRKIDFSATRTPGYLRYSPYSSQLLFSDSGGIYTMSPTDTMIPSAAFIRSNGWNVYGLNADPSTGDIYISDAIDYQQASRVMRYSSTGTLIDVFTSGIITNGFVFQ